MSIDSQAALFILLGQTAAKTLDRMEELVPKERLLLNPSYDVAPLLPSIVRRATEACSLR